ncbi:uncharacterized protein LOC122925913 [Bufo gargarizans]|uniref:uncharacterized protein LOC122925913 n=1 Tax=Bufo gargarizans TaxID=30331 RepID=UPI001CF28368|nr:uncharacterized protein LOC122925913 [Bufo gargarizans]XP_044133193.1 uncharacterized protein LOC122925913 [Bufo gargarizans]
MDLRSKETEWLAQVTRIFKEESIPNPNSIQPDVSETQKLLKNLYRSRTKTWWNKAALEQYLTRDLAPRGLRVQVCPSFPLGDDILKQRWEDACKLCSRTFIELLIGYEKKQLEDIEKSIAPLQDKLRLIGSPEMMARFEQDLNNDQARWEKEIQEQKAKKFQRDIADYQNERIFRWHYKRNTDRSASSSVTSIRSNHSQRAEGSTGVGQTMMTSKTPIKRKYNNLDDSKNGELKPRRNWRRFEH